MKKNILLLLLLLKIMTKGYAQTDSRGNPIFNSVIFKESKVDNFNLLFNYYTLKDNIDNKQSSVFISANPSLSQIERAAITLPSYFFIVNKNENLLSMIILAEQPKRRYIVVNPVNGEQKELPSKLKGDITMHRANEIVDAKYDDKARLEQNRLYINQHKLTVIDTADLYKEVYDLIKELKLQDNKNSVIKLRSQQEIADAILTESREGGKLDFFSAIKGHEMEAIQIKPGIIDTRIGAALYKWGQAAFELGVNTVDDALLIWEKVKGHPATQRESEYIKLGFSRDLDK